MSAGASLGKFLKFTVSGLINAGLSSAARVTEGEVKRIDVTHLYITLPHLPRVFDGLTIAQIREFLDGHKLAFIGFELDPVTLRDYAARYPDDRSATNLECWDAFERQRPETFAGMYQFWCQRD